MSGDELHLNLPKFAHPLSFLIRLFDISANILRKNSQYFCILVCNFFTAKCYQSRYPSRGSEDLDQSKLMSASQIRELYKFPVLVRHSHVTQQNTNTSLQGYAIKLSI